MLNAPAMTVLDSAGNFYIADSANRAVRKVDVKTGVITTFAGTGMPGHSGDNGPATSAQLGTPVGLAFDRSGNLYISGSSQRVVREAAAGTGIITTVAGSTTATVLGDNGPATSAALEQPTGMAIDSAGNIYFADQGTQAVRKVTASTNVIATVAGTNAFGVTSRGDGGPATSAMLSYPQGVALDASGNVYIADKYNNEIREVTVSNGIINKVIGASTQNCITLSGDGGPAGSSGI